MDLLKLITNDNRKRIDIDDIVNEHTLYITKVAEFISANEKLPDKYKNAINIILDASSVAGKVDSLLKEKLDSLSNENLTFNKEKLEALIKAFPKDEKSLPITIKTVNPMYVRPKRIVHKIFYHKTQI